MKKLFLGFTAFLAFSFLICGCSDDRTLHNVRGLVKNVEIVDDTLKSMTLSAGDEEMVFTLDEARFQQGIMLHGDSVIVDYIKGRETNRAFVVTVLPKVANTIHLGEATSDTLITAPVPKDKDESVK